MVKEGFITQQKGDTVLLVNSTPGYGTARNKAINNRKTGWYIGWSILFMFTLAAQVTITIYVVSDLFYIFQNIKSWPTYSNEYVAHGIIAIGNEAYGIIAIGQTAHGVIAIGQISFGIISIGQLGLGLLFALCQCGGGLCWAVGQGVTAAKVICGQFTFASWKSGPAQIGFNIGSSILCGTPLVKTCKCCSNSKKFNVNTTNSKVRCAVNSIMNGMRYPQYWPKKSKQEFAEALQKYDIEMVITSTVNTSVEGKYHGLHKMNQDEVEEVIRCLLELKYEFKRIAFKHFVSS